MNQPPLFRRYPSLVGRIPWIPLGAGRTPVEPVTVMHAGAARSLLVKRDDLSAQPYGGNKVRKLEFLLADAKQRGAKRVVTAGAYGSHHSLATTIYGVRSGLAVSCVLFPQQLTEHVRTILRLIAGHGAELRFTRRMEGVPFALRRAAWSHLGEHSCIIPPGGSNALGTLGYVNAALELDEQITAGACPAPSVIHVAGGTLGTAAGIALGLALAGRRIPVHAVRITSTLVTNERTLRSLVRGALKLLEPAGSALPDARAVLANVRLRHDQVGEGYGVATKAAEAASHTLQDAGLHLDLTYTAKAAAALFADEPAGTPLFWHTLSREEPEPPVPLDVDKLPSPFRSLLQ